MNASQALAAQPATQLPLVQLEATFRRGRLDGDPLVLIDGEPVGRLPVTRIALVQNGQGRLAWELTAVGDSSDAEGATLRTVALP